jgi:hypothetical protein
VIVHRKGTKEKPLSEALQTVLDRLTASSVERRYSSVSTLLEELEQIAPAVKPHTEAWNRLLQHVRLQSADGAILRLSA